MWEPKVKWLSLRYASYQKLIFSPDPDGWLPIIRRPEFLPTLNYRSLWPANLAALIYRWNDAHPPDWLDGNNCCFIPIKSKEWKKNEHFFCRCKHASDLFYSHFLFVSGWGNLDCGYWWKAGSSSSNCYAKIRLMLGLVSFRRVLRSASPALQVRVLRVFILICNHPHPLLIRSRYDLHTVARN